MNQALHIFLKDMRRFWAEIFLSLAITAVFVGIGAYLRGGTDDVHNVELGLLAGLLGVLVPVSWWVLITRAIHAERLVGDTQFWITRPYVWGSLLGSKLIFLAAFLFVPFFIAQLILLAEAGFAPLLYIPGLLFNLLLIAGIVILPLASIGAVTSSFVRMTLTILGIFLLFIAFTTVMALAFAKHGSGVSSRIGGNICFVVAVLVFATTIVLQYAWRRVWIARWLLIALPVVLIAILWAASNYDLSQMDRVYPLPQGGAPIQFSYSPDQQDSGTSSFQKSSRTMIPISIPLAETGVAERYAVLPDAVKVELKAPDGAHWESDWQGLDGYRFLSGESRFKPGFFMPMAIYQKLQSTPLTVHLVFAITQAQAGKVTTIAMQAQRFPVPELGVCLGQIGLTPLFGQMTGINCVSAVREPQLTYIGTHWSDAACSASNAAPESGVLGTGWAGSLDSYPAQLGISPVVDLHVNLSNNMILNTPGGKPRYLCPGTPITFTQYTAVRRRQTSVDFQGFILPKITVQGNIITITQTESTTTQTQQTGVAIQSTVTRTESTTTH